LPPGTWEHTPTGSLEGHLCSPDASEPFRKGQRWTLRAGHGAPPRRSRRFAPRAIARGRWCWPSLRINVAPQVASPRCQRSRARPVVPPCVLARSQAAGAFRAVRRVFVIARCLRILRSLAPIRSPPRVLVRSGPARYAVADDAAPPRVPGKPALAQIGATGPLARPRACAGKVKKKSHGARQRAHHLGLAVFLPSGRLVRLAGACRAPVPPRFARSARR
jgi:hypothetical protein